MHRSLCLLALLAAPLPAQSPLVTSSVSRASMGVAGPYTQVYFDLTVNTPLSIQQIDAQLLLYGTAPRLDVYTCTGTYVANTSNPQAWTLLGSSRVVIPPNSPMWSPADELGLLLSPGTYGICLSYADCSVMLATGVPLNYANSDLSLQFGAYGYSPTLFDPRVGNGVGSCCVPTVMDCRIHYQYGAGFAGYRAFGDGCVDQYSSFYQRFTPGTFDLGGNANQTHSLLLLPTNGGYLVSQAPGGWHTPTTPPLIFANSALIGPLPLGFVFPYPGGSTTDIFLATNGVVQLERGCAPCSLPTSTAAPFTLGEARLAALWQFLGITAGGTITFDSDPVQQVAYATWGLVPDGAGTPNTFQVALDATGTVEFRYRACSNSSPFGGEILVGFTPGHGAPEPPMLDLSAATPFATRGDNQSLRLLPDARPVLGASVNLTTANVPANSAMAALLLGTVGFDPGLDLGPVGMPQCRQFARGDVLTLVAANAPSTVVPLAIPNITALSGVRVFAQTAVLSSGFNPLGVLASNGLDLRLGL